MTCGRRYIYARAQLRGRARARAIYVLLCMLYALARTYVRVHACERACVRVLRLWVDLT